MDDEPGRVRYSRGVSFPIARVGVVACLVALAAAVVATEGCRRVTPSGTRVIALDGVLVAKCTEIVRGPICRIGVDRTVHVYVPGGVTDVVIRADGVELLRAATTGADGRRFAVDVPRGAADLTVTGRGGGEARVVHRTVVDASPPPPWLDDLRTARERGALDDAARIVDAAEARAREVDASDARLSAEMASIRARFALSRGDAEAAVVQLGASAAMHADRGETSRAADDFAARAHVLIGDLRRAAEAKATIAHLASFAPEYPEAGAYAAYYEGALAGDAGDLGASLARFADARAQADRLGVAKITRAVIQGSTNMLLAVGRAEEAHAELVKLETAEGPAMTPCERATLQLNVGWAALLVGDAPSALGTSTAHSARAHPDALTPLRSAVATFAGPCANPRLQASALDNLAWAELQAGDVAHARKALADARALSPHPKPLVAFGELQTEGRIALAEGDPKGALRVYDTLATRASGVSRLDEEAAEEGRAVALARIGDRASAIAAATRAETLVDESARAIPAGEGRGAFWWARARLAGTLVSLLLEAGRPSEALDAARTARARILWDVQRGARVSALSPAARARWEQGLGAFRSARNAIVAEANDDWSLTGEALVRRSVERRARDVAARARLDALASEAFPVSPTTRRPLAEDDGVVGFSWVALGEGAWAAFVVERGVTRVVRVAATTDPALAADALPVLMGAVAPALTHATRLRVLPLGAIADLDIGGFELAGASLLARMPIEYTLDSAYLPGEAAGSEPPMALVVADPTNALPAAHREGLAVADALRVKAQGLDGGDHDSVRLLVGADATRARVLGELAHATSVHFAGHASYGGVDGWDSALFLAHGERLSVSDVLALDHVPSRVVLSGCETGREGERGGPVGVGLADAFIAAGSRSVIASTRRVDDATTETLMRALAAAFVATPDDAAFALRRAQLEMRRTLPSADGSAFRAFVR